MEVRVIGGEIKPAIVFDVVAREMHEQSVVGFRREAELLERTAYGSRAAVGYGGDLVEESDRRVPEHHRERVRVFPGRPELAKPLVAIRADADDQRPPPAARRPPPSDC